MKSLLLLIISAVISSGCQDEKAVLDTGVQLNKDEYFVQVDKMPMPEGGMEAIQAGIVYPEEAKQNGIEGKVMVQAFIDEEGNVKIAEVLKGAGPLLDKAALDAVRDVKFTPGYNEGKAVKTQVAIPIMFKLKENSEKDAALLSKKGEYYTEATEMPDIIGGIKALSDKIKYPEAEKKAGTQGKVYVQLFIDEKGNIEKKEIIEGVNPALDRAALDAFDGIRFTPGKIEDKPVKIKLVVPIQFKLQ
jgi:TonB family protein